MSTLFETRETIPNRTSAVVLSGMALVGIPAIIFYAILFRKLLNVPFLDDYRAILDVANRMAILDPWDRFRYLLTAQHNEYKLIFEHGVLWLQLILFRRIDFRTLCVVGDLFVVLIGIALWKIFLPSRDLASRLMLFVPAAWLLFQLQYVETLNWAMASLQNLPVIAFSLLAIYLLGRDVRKAFGLAVLFLIAAVASSGNGFLVIPVGALMLGLGRRYFHLAIWSAVSLACVAIYSLHYNTASSQSPVHQSILSAAIHINPAYPLSFVGNFAAFPIYGGYLGLSTLLCPLIGLSLCIFFVFAARTYGSPLRETVYFFILFLLLTAIGVGCMRSDLGFVQSLASRYGIYSTLLLICAWFLIAEHRFGSAEGHQVVRSRLWQGVVASSICFAVLMDVGGYRYLVTRNNELIRGISAYEVTGSKVGPILPGPTQPRDADLLRKAPAILLDSQKLGLYKVDEKTVKQPR